MSISADSAKAIARLGVNMELTENSKYSSDSVKAIVQIVKEEGAHITVHAGDLSSDSLKAIARIGKSHITIAI